MEALEDIMYHVPQPPRARKEPMQVLALGISRSGTESLRAALLHLGYNHTYHGFDVSVNHDTEAWVRLWRRKCGIGGRAQAYLQAHGGEAGIPAADFDAIIGHCTALTDMPACAFASELIAAYPDAKVILNKRHDLDAWHKSVAATFTAYRQSPLLWFRSRFSSDMHWLHCFFTEMWDRFFYGSLEANGKWVYRDHCAKIRGLVPPERLLEWSVADGWQPLCEFLGKSQHDLPAFPKGNAPAEFMEKTLANARAREARARRNMGITGCIVAVICSVLAWAVSNVATR